MTGADATAGWRLEPGLGEVWTVQAAVATAVLETAIENDSRAVVARQAVVVVDVERCFLLRILVLGESTGFVAKVGDLVHLAYGCHLRLQGVRMPDPEIQAVAATVLL